MRGLSCSGVRSACRPARGPYRQVVVTPCRHFSSRRTAVSVAAASEDAPVRQNKLNIPYDALADIAGGLAGSKSRLDLDMLSSVADLPMTDGLLEYQLRAEALQQWQQSLSKGVLPDMRSVPFPADPFRTKFAVRPGSATQSPSSNCKQALDLAPGSIARKQKNHRR